MGDELIDIIVQDAEDTYHISVIREFQHDYELLYYFKNIKNPSEKVCLVAVNEDGYALRYVKEQTEEIALAAVKQNGWALKYVKEQTEEIALEAVKQNEYALEYVKPKFKKYVKNKGLA